jgi:cytochrome c oxidase cbb3-type subunit 1
MLLPVVAFMMNIYLSMRGNWSRFFSSIPLRFMVTGWAAYILVSYQGSHQALQDINLLTHFTQYVPGHAHLALLLFGGSSVMGGMYYVIPRIYKSTLYSRNLANMQYSLFFIGFIFFFGGFLLTGFVQGATWLEQGLPIWSVLPGLRPYMAMRAIGGALIVISFIIFTFNIFATAIQRKPVLRPVLPPAAPEALAQAM